MEMEEAATSARDRPRVRAALCQCMKALHEFSGTGSWKVAWPLTLLQDPMQRPRHGGTEVEMETIMAYLRTQDDLSRRVHKGVGEEASDAGDAAEEAAPARPKRKARGPGKGGAGAAGE